VVGRVWVEFAILKYFISALLYALGIAFFGGCMLVSDTDERALLSKARPLGKPPSAVAATSRLSKLEPILPWFNIIVPRQNS
jgi:hypothetical protein